MRFEHLPGLRFEFEAPRVAPALRLDVAAFVGVSPRGPARVPVVNAQWPAGTGQLDPARPRRRSVPVAIDSLDDYRLRFGAPEPGSYLGRAVRQFFAQGGRRCWVMRIVSRTRPAPSSRGEAGTLRADGGPTHLGFVARDEGAWGNGLRGSLQLHAQAAPLREQAGRWLSDDPAATPVGSLLRWRAEPGAWQLARVESLVRERGAQRDDWVLGFDAAPATTARCELLQVDAGFDDGSGQRERFTGCGLDPRHPRALATVLCDASRLVWPEPAWADLPLRPQDPALLQPERFGFAGGADAFDAITPEDFFDPLAPEGFWREPPEADDEAGEGIDALRALLEPALLVVPDLYHPSSLQRDVAPIPGLADQAGAAFAPCRPSGSAATPAVAARYAGLQLDARQDLARILALQRRLVAFAAWRAGGAGPLLTLLDAPPDLSGSALQRWRRAFLAEPAQDAAAYAPWLLAADADGRLRPLPPSAIAAGVIAARERQDGLTVGPAQQLAMNVAQTLQPLRRDELDALHHAQLNLLLHEAEGIQLAGARTLSAAAEWRAIATRRMLQALVRWLHRESSWWVFEPLNEALREAVAEWIAKPLRRLWRAGGLRGANEREAYFVRVELEPSREGELRVEIGLALAEPLEFIRVRLALSDDGLRVAEGIF